MFVMIRLRIGRNQQPAAKWMHAKNFKKVSRFRLALDGRRLSVLGHGKADNEARGEYTQKYCRVISIDKIRGKFGGILPMDCAGGVNEHQLIRIANRKFSQQ